MGSLSVGTSAPGWDSSIAAMLAMPSSLKSKVTKNGRTLAEPLAREIRAEGASQGSHAASVARTLKSSTRGGVPVVIASGKPYTLGAEFGGQHRRTTYASTSPLGRRYLILQRRTTMQFRPHKGQAGYFFTPTISAGGRGRAVVLHAWAELLREVIREF